MKRRLAKSPTHLVIEIGSGSILFSLGTTQAEVAPPLWSHREVLPYKHITTTVDVNKVMMTGLMRGLLEVTNAGMVAIQPLTGLSSMIHITVVYTAPWSQTLTLRRERRHDTTVNITRGAIELLLKEHQDSLVAVTATTGSTRQEMIPLVTEVNRIFVNGYVVPPSFAVCQGSTLAVDITSVLVDASLHRAVVDLLDKTFTHYTVRWFSNAVILPQIIKTSAPHVPSYLLIDVTYETTELSMVHDGITELTSTVAIGVHTLVRNLAGASAQPFEHVYSSIMNGHDDQTPQRTVKAGAVLHTYQEELQKTALQLFHNRIIPPVCFVRTNDNVEDFFIKLCQVVMRNSPHTSAIKVKPLSWFLSNATIKSTPDLISRWLFHTSPIN